MFHQIGAWIVTLRVLRLEVWGVSNLVTAFSPLSLTIDAFGVSFARQAPARDIRLPDVDRISTGAFVGSLIGPKGRPESAEQIERAQSWCHSRTQLGETEETDKRTCS